MKSSAKLEVQLVVDACLKGGITYVVLSPGSRNAPLSIAFDEHPAFTTFVVPDERAAAFYALGMAQQLGKPVAISCTSGSAPLNYFPAIAEAYYQGVPLVVITADRPKEWVDQGDGQTIVQENVFGSHVLSAAQLNTIHNDQQRWLFERQCAETIQLADGRKKGPVHLNLPFNEPLYQTTDDTAEIRQWIRLGEGTIALSGDEERFVAEKWNRAQRPMIICGQLKKDEKLEKALTELASDPSVAILVEHTSNIQSRHFVQCIDRSLNRIRPEEATAYSPDLIVVLGGAIVSKRIKTFLRAVQGVETLRVGPDFPFMDTFQSLVYTTAADPSYFVSLLAKTGRKSSGTFGNAWKQLDFESEAAHTKFLDGCAFSDLKAMEVVLDVIPEGAQLHIANSSIIRYALLFDPVKSVRYWCNRGTSGIDGSSSTACGAALMDPDNCHVLVSGDMSFFYDSNAFWTNCQPSNLRVFVLNNGGGDIFNIIPGPDTTPQKDRYFVATQQFSAEYICKTYGLDYFSADSVESIESQLMEFFAYEGNNAPKLMEIHTAGLENSAILKKYFADTKEG